MSPASLLRCVFLRRRNGRACCFIKNANSLYCERLAGAVSAKADALHLHPLLLAGSQTRLGRAAAAGVTN